MNLMRVLAIGVLLTLALRTTEKGHEHLFYVGLNYARTMSEGEAKNSNHDLKTVYWMGPSFSATQAELDSQDNIPVHVSITVCYDRRWIPCQRDSVSLTWRSD